MRKRKFLLAAGATLAALTMVTPTALADPVLPPQVRPLAGVGSDTTQDVMNALSEVVAIGGVLQVASYNALGGGPDVFNTRGTPPTCDITRSLVNGSSAGVAGLQDSLEGVRFTGTGGAPCLDWARSSSNSSTSNPSNPPGGPGRLSYIPFAVDALTMVTRDDSALPNQFSLNDPADPLRLTQIYNCAFSTDEIRPVVPQIGSGTRQFFLDQLGIPRPDHATFEATRPCINFSFPGRVGPQEHRGNQLADPRDIAPYSTAVFTAQVNDEVVDAHGRTFLNRVNALRSALPNPAATGGVGITLRAYDSALPSTFTAAELGDVYNCVTDPAGTDIRPVLPAPGAVRTAFLNVLGVPAAQHAAYHTTRPCINLDFLAGGRVGPAENTGSLIADGRSVMPYSIEAYTAQINREVTDVHGNVIFGEINSIASVTLNTAGTMRRDVYNVIPTSREATAPWSTVFVGPSALICQNTAIINRLGFGTAANCGALGIRTT